MMTSKEIAFQIFDQIDTNIERLINDDELTDDDRADLLTMMSEHYGQLADKYAEPEPSPPLCLCVFVSKSPDSADQ